MVIVKRRLNDSQGSLELQLFTPEVQLIAVINALASYSGKHDAYSEQMLESVRKQLDIILSELPRGIVYLTHSAKEGVYALRSALDGSFGDFTPLYSIKRFETSEKAEHVRWLSNFLSAERASREADGKPVYLRTPNTPWSLEMKDCSVLFSDAIIGKNLVEIMPQINFGIETGGDKGALFGNFKENVILSVLDNIAWWHAISPAIAVSAEYALDDSSIPPLVASTVNNSIESLLSVTDSRPSEKELGRMRDGAQELSALIMPVGVVGFDFGPRNTIIHKEVIDALESPALSQNLSSKAYARANIWQVDVPSEWKTIPRMRELVRFLFALDVSWKDVPRYAAYYLLKSQELKHSESGEFGTDYSSAASELSRLSAGKTTPEKVPLYARYREQYPSDLPALVAAEAARMTNVIPHVFLSKVKAECEGRLPRTISNIEAMRLYDRLVDELKQWALRGKEAVEQIMETGGTGRVRTLAGDRQLGGLYCLFSSWVSANIVDRDIPGYEPFRKI